MVAKLKKNVPEHANFLFGLQTKRPDGPAPHSVFDRDWNNAFGVEETSLREDIVKNIRDVELKEE